MAPAGMSLDAASSSHTSYESMVTALVGSRSAPLQSVIAQTMQANAEGFHAIAYDPRPTSEPPAVGGSHLAEDENVLGNTDTESTDASGHPLIFVGGQPIPMILSGESTPMLGERRIVKEAQSVLVHTPEPDAEAANTNMSEHDELDINIAGAKKDGPVEASSDANLFLQYQLEVLQRILMRLQSLDAILGLLSIICLISFSFVSSNHETELDANSESLRDEKATTLQVNTGIGLTL